MLDSSVTQINNFSNVKIFHPAPKLRRGALKLSYQNKLFLCAGDCRIQPTVFVLFKGVAFVEHDRVVKLAALRLMARNAVALFEAVQCERARRFALLVEFLEVVAVSVSVPSVGKNADIEG